MFGNVLDARYLVAYVLYVLVLGWLGAAEKLSGLFLVQSGMQKAELRDRGREEERVRIYGSAIDVCCI